MKASENLKRLKITLPTLISPSGTYAHATRSGNLLFLAGKGVGLHTGKVGAKVSVQQAQEFARSTTLMLLAVIESELGTINRVEQFLKVTGFVNSAPDFSDHSVVLDACSDLLREVFGTAGIAARTSIGVAATPGQIPVEIEAIVRIKD